MRYSIIIASDHRGYKLKEKIKKIIKKMGHRITDSGTFSEASVDYPDYAKIVSEFVSKGYFDRGILICGTGIGMSIAANKFKKIYAARVLNPEDAYLSRAHNNSNVLCLPGNRLIKNLKKILSVWLNTRFSGGRHNRRITKIDLLT
ncbi:MAG: ribose 5-phosphate isomerase B [bacterium]|nr:ribose 5-phosphate isomerase B [bacterium]